MRPYARYLAAVQEALRLGRELGGTPQMVANDVLILGAPPTHTDTEIHYKEEIQRDP